MIAANSLILKICFQNHPETQTLDQILEFLGKNPKMTREDIAQALAKSPNTIKGYIPEGKKIQE